MKLKITLLATVLLFALQIKAQEPIKIDSLKEVIITSTRIDLPFKENSRTITVISSDDIKNSAATNVTDLLQQFAGIDVRRQGVSGMQADLYIRGGGFDQTLLLIDGIKVEDAQSGHHTLNLALPVEVIERIEIIKGPAARVFGQNAFTGAVNIITKKSVENLVSVKTEVGTFNQFNAGVTLGGKIKNTSHIVQISRNTSDGYRYNTDFKNQNFFVKSSFNTHKTPIDVIASFLERKFGANGFYVVPKATDQYEETQASLLGISSTIKKNQFVFKPKLYWRRNQDMYLYVRSNPSLYKNLHITNKVGASLDVSYTSSLGITGFGVDIANVTISSNNLGNRNRFITTLFLEHRFKLINDKLDITPGVALNYFSDFKFHAFPGIDVGFKINENFKIYGNVGYTYRIPTYTDLFYSDRSTIGNENLQPEKAISEEIGIKFNKNNFSASLAVFNRDAKNRIDYTKENEADLWQATNISSLITKGFEAEASYLFKIANQNQSINISYNFLKDDLNLSKAMLSKYAVNSLKHHAIVKLHTNFLKNVSQNIIYKYAERVSGESYGVLDTSINFRFTEVELSLIINNILNQQYTENLLPMPKINALVGLKYNF